MRRSPDRDGLRRTARRPRPVAPTDDLESTPASAPNASGDSRRSSLTSRFGAAPPRRTLERDRLGSNPGASIVRRHSPERITTKTKRPRSSVAVVSVTGAALVYVPPVSARTVAPRMVAPVSSRTTPPMRLVCAKRGSRHRQRHSCRQRDFGRVIGRSIAPDRTKVLCHLTGLVQRPMPVATGRSQSAVRNLPRNAWRICAASRAENPQCAGLRPRSSSCDHRARIRPRPGMLALPKQQVADLVRDRPGRAASRGVRRARRRCERETGRSSSTRRRAARDRASTRRARRCARPVSRCAVDQPQHEVASGEQRLGARLLPRLRPARGSRSIRARYPRAGKYARPPISRRRVARQTRRRSCKF